MWMTRKAVGSIATLGAILALTACGGPGGNEAGKRTLTIGVPETPDTLNPALITSTDPYAIVQLTAGTLTNQERDGQVVMGLAESVQLGEKSAVIKLKPDLKFSDGSALTSTDVVASFNYYVADELNPERVFDEIKSVTAVDDLTVNVDLKHPNAEFPADIASPRAAILPSASIEARGKDLYTGDPIPAAGPFQVESFSKQQITLHANPHYAGEQPTTETLKFERISDPAARLAQVKGGQLDFATSISPKQARQLSAPVEVRTTEHFNGANYLGMNNRKNSVLSDVRIRKAIAVAIDRGQINKVAYAGLNQPALSLSNASPLNDPISYLSADPDIEGAKELLAGTKCAHGCTMRFIADSADEAVLDTATVIQQNLKRIGIQVRIQKNDASTILEWRSKGDFDLAVAQMWGPVPGAYVEFTLGTSRDALRSGYSSPEMIRLVEDALYTTGSERAAAFDGINALYEKDMPYPPIGNLFSLSASRVPSETFEFAPSFFYRVG